MGGLDGGGRMEQSDHRLPEGRPFFLRNRESSDPSREPRILLGPVGLGHCS